MLDMEYLFNMNEYRQINYVCIDEPNLNSYKHLKSKVASISDW